MLFNITMQVGYLSPPFGQAAFYLKSVAPPEISLNRIFASLLPFIGLQIVGLLIMLFFPKVACSCRRCCTENGELYEPNRD